MYLCWKLTMMMMMMMMALVCVTESFRGPRRAEVTCCTAVSKGRIPPYYKVTGFNHQNALGECVEAIIFYTDKGTICSDPNAHWVQNRMKDPKKNKN